MLYKVARSMRLDFSSFPLDVFNNSTCAFLSRRGLLSDSIQGINTSEWVIWTLGPTLNGMDYSEISEFYPNFDKLKKGLEYLIRDTISLISENQKILIPIIRKSIAVIYVSIASVSNTAYQSKSSILSRIARFIFLSEFPFEARRYISNIIGLDNGYEERMMNELCSIFTLSLFLNIAIQLNGHQQDEIKLLINFAEELIRQRQFDISFSRIEIPLLFEDYIDKMPNCSQPSLEYYLFQNYRELKNLALYKKDTEIYLEPFVKGYCKNGTKYKLR